MAKKIIGYKAFDQDLKCRGYQYEVGKEFVHEGDIKLCNGGLHFCERPLDVIGFYYPKDGARFALVEASDVSPETEEDDSKRVAKRLYVKAELTLHSLIEASVKSTLDNVSWLKKTENKKDKKAASNSGHGGAASNSGYGGAASNSGDYGAASNSGDYGAASNSGKRGAASNSGDYGAASNSGHGGAASNSGHGGAASNSGYGGAASNSGDYGAASNSGKEGVAVALGIEAKGRSSLGGWITLSEWKYDNDEWQRIDVQTKKVDGKKIKADTFYVLKDGKFVIAE